MILDHQGNNLLVGSDLVKASDIVAKLAHYGVREILLKLLESLSHKPMSVCRSGGVLQI